MNTNNRQNFRPTQHEIDDVTRRSRRDALKGSLAGGLAGTLVGAKYKKKLIGAAVGATAGDLIGRRVGRREGAKDVVKSRQALLQNMARRLDRLETEGERLFESIDDATAATPVSAIQRRPVARPSVRGMRSEPGNGVSAEALFAEARQGIASRWGWGIASSLADDELTDEHAEALHNAIMGKIQKADSPSAGVKRGEDFERGVLAQHMGARVVEAMGPAEVHAHFLGAVRKGLIELDDQSEVNEFEILNRVRSSTGEFAPNESLSPDAVARAYHPRDRRTGIEPGTGALAAGATGVGALALLRARKGKRARLTGGSTPKLGFAAKDDGAHPVRDTLAGVGAGALGVAAALALRKRRRLRLPTGVPKLPPRTIDVETETLSRRVPLLTSFVKGPGSYIIRRATLRGKKQPGVPKLKIAGKKKPTELAFLIHDPDFPLLPMKQPKLAPGMKQRVPVAKTRAEVLKRLKQITALSREFGIGALAAEGLVDAASLGGLAGETANQRKARLARLAQQQQNAAADSDTANDSTAQPRTLDGALQRMQDMDFSVGGSIAKGAARFAPEVAAIGAGDVIGESVHDRLKAAQDKKRRRLMRQRGGVEPLPGMGTAAATQTTMSALRSTLMEFDSDGKRDAARRHAATLGASGLGAAAGTYGALATYKPGRPAQPGEDLRGKRVYVKRKSVLPSYHVGTGGEEGVVHRTPGRDSFREVKGGSFRKIGKGGLRVEDILNGKSPDDNARAASGARGASAGRYSIARNNCEHGADRIVGGRGISRQSRRAIGGAAAGALAGGTLARFIQGHPKEKGK